MLYNEFQLHYSFAIHLSILSSSITPNKSVDLIFFFSTHFHYDLLNNLLQVSLTLLYLQICIFSKQRRHSFSIESSFFILFLFQILIKGKFSSIEFLYNLNSQRKWVIKHQKIIKKGSKSIKDLAQSQSNKYQILKAAKPFP